MEGEPTVTIYHLPGKESKLVVEEQLLGRRIVGMTVREEEWTTRLTVGRTAVIELDNGTMLEMVGHDGGCACNAGCYYLDPVVPDLSKMDNIITAVHFDDSPGGEDSEKYRGTYSIFVVVNDEKLNLATFAGTDGNGYYGTGYFIRIKEGDRQ